MSGKVEGTLVPKLRFPEFKADWKTVAFSELCDLKGRIGYRGYTVEDIVSEEVGVIALSPSNISAENRLQHKNDTYISWFKYEESPEIMVENNHILLVKTGSSYGKAALVEDLNQKATLNPQVVVIKPRSCNSRFLYSIVIGSRFQKQIHENVVGGALPTLSQASVLSFSVSTPNRLEQEKIADFLGAVEARIGLLKRRRDALCTYKKGMMQRLLTQDLRFTIADGSAFPDWQEMRLGQVVHLEMGQSPASTAYNEEGIGAPLIQGNADVINRKSAPRRYTTEVTKMCSIGDILISVRAPIGEIAVAVHDACIGRGIASVRVRESNVQNYWYQVLLNSESRWTRIGQGSTFSAISGPDIRNLNIAVPDPREQQKIADFLSAIDAKIDAVTAQIEAMQRFKKVLLQQMFV